MEHLIKQRKEEIEQLKALDAHIDELNKSVGLSPNTYREIKAKISSRMAQCEISIRDHS